VARKLGGTYLPLGNAVRRAQLRANRDGFHQLLFNGSQNVCGAPFLSLDVASCTISNIAQIP
jgi:hypothetical protein